MVMRWEDWSWLVFNFVVLTPIGLYFTVKYLERYKRGDNVIALRRPRLVLCTLFGSLYYICFHQSIYILLLGFVSDTNHDHKWEFLFDSIGYQIIFILYFWRSWHTYFGYQYNRLKADHIWKYVINENYDRIAYENKIFIKYAETLGNPKYTLYVILVYILLYSLIITISIYIGSLFIAEYVAFIDLIIIIIPFIYLFYNISTVYDTIYIRNEILIQSIVILLFLILEIMVIFIINQSPQKYKHDNDIIHIELLLESILPSIAFFINILMSTFYVFHRQNGENREYENYRNRIKSNNNKSASSHLSLTWNISHSKDSKDDVVNSSVTLSRPKSKSKSKSKSNSTHSIHHISHSTDLSHSNINNNNHHHHIGHVDLVKLLQQKEGFKSFVDHCVKEYALENLLCIIEITQFKKYCIEEINEDKDGMDKKKEFNDDLIIFYSGIPQSKIVENRELNIKDKFISLYEKYIDSGKASWEVNIAALSRKQLLKQYRRFDNQRFIKKTNEENINNNNESRRRSVNSSSSRFDYDSIGNHEIYQIIQSFNGALKDVMKCLNDSYSRFHITKQYKQWHKQYVINNTITNKQQQEHKNNNTSSIIKLKSTSTPINDDIDDEEDEEKYNNNNHNNNNQEIEQ